MRWTVLVAALLLAGTAPSAARQSANAPAADAEEPTIEELRARARAGEVEAQNLLGGRLLETQTAEALAEARTWFERAGAAGHAEAKNNFASMLATGIGGPADEARARALREEAAREGSVGAHLTIAEAYLRGGYGYPRDAVRAFQHVQTAASLQSPNRVYVQWRLAMMHLQGVGTARNPREAYRILVETSEAGGVHAMISRAVMLATGEGVAEDDASARIWYQRAAESGEIGFAHALRGLGSMLASGEGGAVDLPRGIAYLRLAAAAGDPEAPAILDHFRDRVTTEVASEAHRIATAWLDQHLSGSRRSHRPAR